MSEQATHVLLLPNLSLLRVHLDRLVRTTSDKPRTRLVECRTEDALSVSLGRKLGLRAYRLGIQGTGLWDILQVLER
jgi:hypothetical protein